MFSVLIFVVVADKKVIKCNEFKTEIEQDGKLADICLIRIVAYSGWTHEKAWQIGYAINRIRLKMV